MSNLILPASVKLRVVDRSGQPVPIPKILFRIHAFARYKNDFYLQPFSTNAEGIVAISRADLESEVAATYDSGVMDYRSINECDPRVEISVLTPEEIKKAIDARTRVWRNLLAGEEKRWSSINELIELYRQAANDRVRVNQVGAEWDG